MAETWKDVLAQQLQRHEGIKQFAYTDTVGKVTCGIGRNLTDKGLSKAEIVLLLTHDIADAEVDARRLLTDPIFDSLSDVRKGVICNMAFNMGYSRLARFTVMVGAAKAGEHLAVAREMRHSLWAKQVGARAEELAKLWEEG